MLILILLLHHIHNLMNLLPSYVRRILPDKDAPRTAAGNKNPRIRTELHAGDNGGMPGPEVRLGAFRVLPEQHDFIVSAGHKVLPIRRDVYGVNGARSGAFQLADFCAIEHLPVADLAVGADGEDLYAVRGVVLHGHEERVGEEHDPSSLAHQVPDDASAVGAGAHRFVVLVVDVDSGNRAFVLFQRADPLLVVGGDVPEADLTLAAAAD